MTLPPGEDEGKVVDRIENLLEIPCNGFAPLDVDLDGTTNFRDIVFTYRRMNEHPTITDGTKLPEGVTIEEVNDRIDCLIDLDFN
jgi:hypothetical protein